MTNVRGEIKSPTGRGLMKMHNRILIAAALVAALTAAPPSFKDDAGAAQAADIQSVPVTFYHETPEEPLLTQLQSEFDFSNYISAGFTEFEEMTLLKDWVYSRIPYDLNYDDSELRNAILVLRRARKGDAFICTTKSTVYMQCAVSLGWTSRLILLKKPTGEEHAGNDIWSNQYRKWVYIDTTWNIHVERSGVPLSIQEIQREWLKNNGRDIEYVFGAGKNAQRYTARDLPIARNDSKIWKLIPLDASWLSYSGEITVVGRNDFFSCCKRNEPNGWDPLYVARSRPNWRRKIRLLFSGGRQYSPDMLFYDLNRVDVAIAHPKGRVKERQGNTIEVRLDAFGKNNYTPNFMEYLVQINNNEWKMSDERFMWDPGPGNHIVRARIMNRFGVVGPVTVMRVYIAAKKKKKNPEKGRRSRRPVYTMTGEDRHE
jgi:hypothetical protein